MQTASFDYSIRNVQGTIIGTATCANEALDAGSAEHERTGQVVSVHAPDGSEVARYGDRKVSRVPEVTEGTTETLVGASRSAAALAALHEIAWHRDPADKWSYDYGLALSAAQREKDDNLSAIQAALMQGRADPTLAEHLSRALEDRRKLDRAETAWRSMSQALADLYV